jgi:dTDP-4-dehydrorhamnose reductase
MRIAITGAGGLVGRHLSERLARAHEMLPLRHADLDITDNVAVRRLVESERPELIINCVVVGVDECERDEPLAQAVNVEGPEALAAAAASLGSEIVHFSSNYVFGGEPEGRTPYTTADDTHPVNVYGRTKLAGELAVCSANPRSYVVRTSWVYGPGKESFLATAHARLRSGMTVRAITDTRASTTYVEDLVDSVDEILARRVYGTYHVVNEGVCSYYDFALEAARLVGLGTAEAERLIETVREEEMGRAAPRPRYTPMRCVLSEELRLRPLRDWRAALAAYVQAG